METTAAFDSSPCSARRHLAGHPFLRCLLVGEPGTAKSTSAEVLAKAVGAPFLRVALAAMAESTWRGADLADHVEALCSSLVVPGTTREHARARVVRAVVLLDDLDVVRAALFATTYGDGDRGQRLGRQASISGLYAGTTLPVGDYNTWLWDTSRVLLLAAGNSRRFRPMNRCMPAP